MLPVSSWPPGPPGASLSPFARPRQINVGQHCNGFVIPKGAWVVRTGANRVVMFMPPVRTDNPARSPGTGLLPGQPPPPPAPPRPPLRQQFVRHNDYLEAWRAWQRCVGRTDPPIRPRPGRRPPNWFGWSFRDAPSLTLVQPNSGGTVLADGQNVVIGGSGCATIIQAFNV